MTQYTRRLAFGACVAAIIAGGIALRSEALDGTLLADDYDHYAMVRGLYPVPRGLFDTYDFVANAGERATLMASGRLPWWTDDSLQLSVLRPLSSALTWADYTLLEASSRAQHIHSLIWWVLLVVAAALLFDALLPTPGALLATAFFVLEEGQTLPVTWVANRNALVALSLGTLGLWAYVRGARGTQPSGRWLAPLLLALGLCGGEHALPLLGYFTAFELTLARDGVADRLRRLTPIVLVAGAYLGLRAALGHGLAGSGFYVSPVGTPWRFAGELLHRFPLLLADLTLGIGAEWHFAGLPYAIDRISFGMLPADALPLPRWQALQLGLGVVACAGTALLLLSPRALRALSPEPRTPLLARFLVLGALLALLPACSALPMSRLTLAAALGADALFACVCLRAVDLVRAPGLGRRVVGAVALLAVLLVHGVHAGRRDYLDTEYFTVQSLLDAHWNRSAELDDKRVADFHVLVIGSRDWVSSWALPFARHSFGLHMPKQTHLLSGASANPHLLTRVGPDELELRVIGRQPEGTVLGTVYRPADRPLHVGDVVDLPTMRVLVEETDRGRPKRVRFSFAPPLNEDHYVLLHSMPDGLRRVPLPAIGQSVRLPIPAYPRPPDRE